MRALSALLLLAVAIPAGAADRQPPYWASIKASKARMRTGPAQSYPVTWLYTRTGLPIRVVATYPGWRKVREVDGTTGWMLVRLLTDARTGIVRAGRARPLRREPADDARVAFRVGPGVVGRVSRCADGWCRLEVGTRAGFIRTGEIWGVDPSEELD